MYHYLSRTEKSLGDCHGMLSSYEMAEYYFDKALSNAKRIVAGQKRVAPLYESLIMKGQILYVQFEFRLSKAVYKRKYDLVSELFPPHHPMILMALNCLIKVLIHTREFDDAERYARTCYECLSSQSVDAESDDIANAAESLAVVTSKLKNQDGGDRIMEAEMLARKAVCIKEQIHGIDHFQTRSSLSSLSDILQLKGNDDEVKVL